MLVQGENYELYNGDCLEVMDKLIKEGIQVDLVVTSPPYYNAKEYSHWNKYEDYLSFLEETFSKVFTTTPVLLFCGTNVLLINKHPLFIFYFSFVLLYLF